MNLATYKTLKVGDIVSPNRGKNKGQRCIVKDIWDITDTDGYREILISANFIDEALSVRPIGRDDLHDIFVSYRALSKEIHMGGLGFNYDPNNIIGHVETITDSNDGLAVTFSRVAKKGENND